MSISISYFQKENLLSKLKKEARVISIKTMRQAKGLTQWQLAEKIGVKQESVTQWETGKTAPKFSRLAQIANALECSIDDLVRSDEEKSR